MTVYIAPKGKGIEKAAEHTGIEKVRTYTNISKGLMVNEDLRAEMAEEAPV